MNSITVLSLGLKERSGIVASNVCDQQLLAHFARIQQVFRSPVKDQDIDLIVKHRIGAR